MTKVAILPEPSINAAIVYRAVAGARPAVAKTVGAALDALTAQWPPEESGTPVVVQNHRPDPFFSLEQPRRLEELMERWRTARDSGTSLPPAQQAGLNAWVDAEVQASGARAAAALADREKGILTTAGWQSGPPIAANIARPRKLFSTFPLRLSLSSRPGAAGALTTRTGR